MLPTILEVYDNSIHFMKEEIFAPVVGFYKVKTPEEAIELTNDNDYGLSASVWTEDYKKGMRVIDQLDTGTTWINQHLEICVETPWGGRKQSGWTKENSAIVLEEYTYQKHIWICMDDTPHTFWENFLKDIID